MLAGSPPRLRGIQVFFVLILGITRFTPAPAGNTANGPSPCPPATVHPRACGEYSFWAATNAPRRGSPPRLRGIPETSNLYRRSGGFTPAPAGNTPRPGRQPRPAAVHPRACGEYVPPKLRPFIVERFTPAPAGNTPAHRSIADPSSGSPPRLRGIQGRRRLAGHLRRFTPAPAGNTHPPAYRKAPPPVHPRACGEYRIRGAVAGLLHGSPPRLRGIRPDNPLCGLSGRFTPAPAGNTQEEGVESGGASVHPRACGEYRLPIFAFGFGNGSPPRLRGIRILKCPTFVVPGSPPRLRGIQANTCRIFASIRFTPAPAGNTRRCDGLRRPSAVHPRACGEYPIRLVLRTAVVGSPPRLRGILGALRRRGLRIRFTPAPAGNTSSSPYGFP